ncbi:MAG: class I SAM-dependent methyltransferase [Armatimonadaceae bacterium]
MFFTFAPSRVERPELIDSLEPSNADFAASFADVARVNRFLGGTAAVLRALPPLIAAATPLPAGRPVRILDLATGSADIPREIVRAVRAGRFGSECRVHITALDNHPKVLALAQAQTPPDQYPEIEIVSGDAFHLPYADNAFDITLCSLAFHHFGFDRCVALLREMNRVSAVGLIVNDLLRDAIACGSIYLLTRLLRANRLTQHDAPLSVLRAYTRQEYKQMARDAELPNATVRLFPMYRAVISAHKALNAQGKKGIEQTTPHLSRLSGN